MGGFEPLLQFAYTSQLLFTKENIHDICRSAECLGFRDLESSCFDFLIPKFTEGKRTSQELRRGAACCQSPDAGMRCEFVSSESSSRPKSSEPHSRVPSGHNEQKNIPSQCPQSAQGQKGPKEESFCLQNCGPQMEPLSLLLAPNSVCPMLSLPCQDTDKADQSQFCDRDILEMGDVFSCGLACELSTPEEAKRSVQTLHAETNLDPTSCPINTSVADTCSDLSGQTETNLEQRMAAEIADTALTALSQQEGFGERSSVEREVAEHLAKGFWSDLCQSQSQTLPQDSMDPNTLAKASDFHWLKQLDLSSSAGDCPFLKDLGTGSDLTPRTDGLSQMEKSPCLSSSINSADDSDLDTDGDTEANNKRAAEVSVMLN